MHACLIKKCIRNVLLASTNAHEHIFYNLKMKLDVNVLRYLGKDDFRTLTAVEMGQKNVRLNSTRILLIALCSNIL